LYGIFIKHRRVWTQTVVHLMRPSPPLFGFTLDDRMLALPLKVVIRALFSVEVTPLPSAPEIVAGVVSYHGTIIPVVDLRVRFGASRQEIDPSDRFIIIRTKKRMLAIVASGVTGVLESLRDATPAEDILPGARYLSGVLPGEERLVLIYDPDAFLSLDEEKTLDAALVSGGG
jgi:purine-binding chemotaxis protein CheW